MASYYSEHDCEPLANNERPNHLLHLARLLIDGGYAADMDMEFAEVFGGTRQVPPASKAIVAGLPTVPISSDVIGCQCPVCLANFEETDTVKQLPCDHRFHLSCILPWLNKVNSCPVCRHELPTDDPEYEAIRKHKARKEQRQYELESLHNSMFG